MLSLDNRINPRYIQSSATGSTPTERNLTMNIQDIYAAHTVGSLGFCKAVETHCGYGLSLEEIKRIAEIAKTPEDFERIWEDEAGWPDSSNYHTAIGRQ